MAITVQKLKEALPGILVEPQGIRWQGEDRTFFHYPPLETDWGEIRLLVNLLDGGRFLQFRSIDFFTLAENQRLREKQIEVLLTANYWRKTVQFGFDPEDGEICLYVDIPIVDSTYVTRKLMERVLASIRVTGGKVLRDLKCLNEEAPPTQKKTQEEQKDPLLKRILRRSLLLFYGKHIRE